MNQLRSNRCPSVHLIIIIIIIVISSCIVAGFSPKLRVVAAEKNKHIAKSQNWPNVNDQESEARRSRRHGFDYLQIKNSSCPNYCECEYIINNNSPDNIPEFSVFCHEGGLEQITFSKLLKQIPREVSILDVTAPEDKPNHLLWDDNLNQLRQLRILRLVNCAIPAISRALKLRTLEVLDLRNNNIQHLSVSIFSGIPSIRELNLAENLLSILPTGAFTYLKNLHTLSLAHNNISKVPVNLLRDLNNLRSLHLDGNQISVQEFNKLFADIPNLKQLELNDCGLSIDLIDDLALDKFTSLHQLGLAGNMLGKVPERVLRNRLTSLMTLDLSRNGLVEIRPEVFAKSNISRLILAGNRLGANRNALSENSLKTNTKLLELDLSRNNFAHFHSGYLGIVRETVEVLHLNGNHIASIEQQLIANMTKLNILHLGYNFIEYLPEKLPDEFAQLTFLNLSGNQLSSLPEHSRTALPLLQKIDISDNRFVSFSITIIQQFFNSLEKVKFQGNPLDCSCHVEELKNHLLDRYAYRHELQYESTCCATPEELQGIPLYRINDGAECTFLFGARYSFSHLSEITFILLALIIFAFCFTVLILFIHSRSDRQKKKYTDVTQSQSRIALTLSQHLSNSPSSLTEPLTPPPESPISGISTKVPPPPPILTDI